MSYEAFEKIQKKVTEVEASIQALRDDGEAKHATSIDILANEIEFIKASLGGKKRRKRTAAKGVGTAKPARKKPGPKPKAVQAS